LIVRNFIALVAVFSVLSEVQAGSPEVPFHFFARSAERIVEGRVLALEPRQQGELIVTDVVLLPEKNLVGSGLDPITLTIPGGSLGATTLHVSKAPHFAVGEDVLVFLRANQWCPVLGWERGKLTIDHGQVRELNGRSLADVEKDILAALGR
jgi:hypothetical protein